MSAGTSAGGSFRILIVLPPDFEAPEDNRAHRFPPQAAALVAASIAEDGIHCRVADLDHDLNARPFEDGPHLLDDQERLHAHLRDAADEEYVAFGRAMIDRILEQADADVDGFALSIDRHTQVGVSLLLGAELKRRFGRPVILGGANAKVALHRSQELGLRGIDFITTAESPREIRAVFASLRELDLRRWEVAVEPLPASLATAPDDWPVPDFSVYDLELYRRDPYLNEVLYGAYDGSVGRNLVLPYHFSWDCQYACTFCGRGGTQSAKSARRAARDLAILAERYDCRSFMLFDAQINLLALDFATALLEMGLDVQWTDSFRVTPRKPKDVLETMARAGCIGLTLGVESASDRMLKRMVKGHTAAQATSMIEDAHALGMFTRVNLLPCFPGETRDDHEITMRWVNEHARQIDEVVPSSFYLATNSPVLKLTERYGITVRGTRRMEGDYKFRKNFGSLEYDEIGGYTWEERAATLRPAEVELFDTWREGRAGLPEIRQATQVFAVRKTFPSKEACYQAVGRWCGPRQEAGPEPVVDLAEEVPVDAPPSCEASVSEPPPPLAPPPASVPKGSVRARALGAAERVAAMRRLAVELASADEFQLGLRFYDEAGVGVTVTVERERPGHRYFQSNGQLGLWYANDVERGGSTPRWGLSIANAMGKLLLAPALRGLGAELAHRPAPPAMADRPEGGASAGGSEAALPVYSVFDLVRLGLKPAAALAIADLTSLPRLTEGLPASALSRFGFVRDAHDNLVVVSDSARLDSLHGQAQRMLYVATTQAVADRLRDLEEGMYLHRDLPPSEDSARRHESFGVELGFPPCCARAFARHGREPQAHADYYASVTRLGWHLRPIDWRLNHVLARHYHLPFLIHVPCDEACAATRELVDRVAAGLYDAEQRRVLEEILSQGVVVYPDDRFLLFRVGGEANSDGEIPVSDFNRIAHPEVMGRRDVRRSISASPGQGFEDSEVERLRVRGDRLEVFARRAWHVYTPAQALDHPAPILVVPRFSQRDQGRSHHRAAAG